MSSYSFCGLYDINGPFDSHKSILILCSEYPLCREYYSPSHAANRGTYGTDNVEAIGMFWDQLVGIKMQLLQTGVECR